MTSQGRKHVGLASATMLLLLTTTATAGAQTNAEIEGSVVDANGNALPGAVVTGSGPYGRQEHVTGVEGEYIAVDLTVGEYLVTAALPGFETTELTIALRAGMRETVRIVMQIARLLETVSVVAEEPRIFARNVVAEPMMMQQSKITGVTSVVDNLPGVSVQEGDAYGFDDWSSNVAVRGFQVTINEAQIGTTIDGFPNGHVRLLERLEGEPLHRPDEPGQRRGVAGNSRHRLTVGRGAGRDVRLPDGRPGGQADLHRVDHHWRERRTAVLHAGRHRATFRP